MKIQSFSEILKTPLIKQYINSLLGIGYDSRRERALTKILIISTFLLSTASGYTTYLGLKEYIPFFISLIATIAIQGLLFTASWRIGATLTASNFKYSLLFIYLITMVTSVFFSYSALLNYIYPSEHRKYDELERAKITIMEISNNIKRDINIERNLLLRNTRNGLIEWNSKFNILVQSFLEGKRKSYTKYLNEYNERINRYKREWEEGGTIVQTEKGKMITPIGRGPYALTYLAQAEEILFSNVNPLKQDLDEITVLIDEHNTSFENFLKDHKTFTIQNLNKQYFSTTELINFIEKSKKMNELVVQNSIYNNLTILEEINSYYDWLNSIFKLEQVDELTDLKNISNSLINRAPIVSLEDKKTYIRKIENIGKLGGSEIHHFVLALGEIKNLNLLAVGSLILAFIIDLLILFCGLMGARPDSFLDMTRPDDLMDVKEMALENILSLDFKKIVDHEIKDKYITRIVEILKNCDTNMEFAHRGIPAVLKKEKIKNLNMSKEVGVLLALGLAHELPNGDLGLRTRLILWMADRVNKYKELIETQKEINSTVKDFLGE